MFVCRGSPEYNWKDSVAKLSPEAFEEWRSACPSISDHTKDKTQEEVCKQYLGNEMMMDDEEVAAWNRIGVEVRIKRLRGLTGPSSRDARAMAETIIQVAVSDVGLMQIKDVDVLEDCCTDNLRDYLKADWRILSVIQPNGARRPTYIIGHVEADANKRRL